MTTTTTQDLIQEVKQIAKELNLRDNDTALQIAVGIQQNKIIAEQRNVSIGLISDLVELASVFYESIKPKHNFAETGASDETGTEGNTGAEDNKTDTEGDTTGNETDTTGDTGTGDTGTEGDTTGDETGVTVE